MDEFFAEEEEMFDAEEPRLEAEAKAFERVGQSGKLAELLSSPGVIGDIGKRGREAISPEDRFLINTDALCRRLNSENVIKITEVDITNMLEKTTQIVGLRYKNYVAYILGYLASQGGKTLKIEQVKFIIKNVLPQVAAEGGLAPADVVRYARFWKEFL
jgi:hypothetical protein